MLQNLKFECIISYTRQNWLKFNCMLLLFAIYCIKKTVIS